MHAYSPATRIVLDLSHYYYLNVSSETGETGKMYRGGENLPPEKISFIIVVGFIHLENWL